MIMFIGKVKSYDKINENENYFVIFFGWEPWFRLNLLLLCIFLFYWASNMAIRPIIQSFDCLCVGLQPGNLSSFFPPENLTLFDAKMVTFAGHFLRGSQEKILQSPMSDTVHIPGAIVKSLIKNKVHTHTKHP